MEDGFLVSFPVFAIFCAQPGKALPEAAHNPPFIKFRDEGGRGGVSAIPIFTDQDLAKRWCEDNPQVDDGLTKWLRLDSPDVFAQYLDRLRLRESVTHIAFDPLADKARSPWVMPLEHIRNELQRRIDAGENDQL